MHLAEELTPADVLERRARLADERIDDIQEVVQSVKEFPQFAVDIDTEQARFQISAARATHELGCTSNPVARGHGFVIGVRE